MKIFEFLHINELEIKMNNKELIYQAHKYLLDHPELKERLTIDNFIKDILNSEITKNILTIKF